MFKKGMMRNRGISIAAAAVSAALVAPLVQPASTALPAAHAQETPHPAPPVIDDGPARTDQQGNPVIWADAIADGYVDSVSNMQLKDNVLSGRAFEVSKEGYLTGTRLPAVPAGTTIYMQWQDTDGAVSPYYAAKVHDAFGGAQGGEGTYAFNMTTPWTDANGVERQWSAARGIKYRLWIPPYERDGVKYNMIRQVDSFMPGAFVDNHQGGNGSTVFGSKNKQFTRVLMGQVPQLDLTTRPRAQWVDGTVKGDKAGKHTVSGRVWKESGLGADRTNMNTGPNTSKGDVTAAGMTVFISQLTPEGKKAYDAAVNSQPEEQRTAAAQEFLRANPDAIAYTRYTKTDKDGYYSIQLPEGAIKGDFARQTDDIWMGTLDENGDVVTGYSPWMAPQFHHAALNEKMVPGLLPNAAFTKLTHVNFALLPAYDAFIKITNFDTADRPAKPGDVAKLELTGKLLPLGNWIEWRDAEGNVVTGGPDTCSINGGSLEGNPCAQFRVPEDAPAGTVYTAVLVNGTHEDKNDISADSFLVVAKNNAEFQPVYDKTEIPQGGRAEILPPREKDGKLIPAATTYSAPADAENKVYGPGGKQIAAFPGTVTIIPNGSIDVTVNEDALIGDYQLPVLVTYPDKSRETVYAPIEVTFAQPGINETPGLNHEITPSWENQKTPAGTPVAAPNVGDELPKGSTVAARSDKGWDTTVNRDVVIVTPPESAKTGDKTTIWVTVTYPDGSQDLEKFTVTVGNPEDEGTTADQITPDWKNAETGPGTPVDVPNTGEKLPTGTKVEAPAVIDGWTIEAGPDDAPFDTIRVTPPAEAKQGDKIEIPVTVTYPDTSVDTETFTVTVMPQPKWDDAETTPTKPVDVPKKDGSGPVQPGTKLEVTGPGTAELKLDGTITVTPKDAKPGDTIIVAVKDPRGTVIDEFTVDIVLGPDWDDAETAPTKPVDVPKKDGSGPVKEGTKLEVTGPGDADLKSDGTITVTPKEGSKTGDTIVVTVSGPGGTIDQFTVTITEPKPVATTTSSASAPSTSATSTAPSTSTTPSSSAAPKPGLSSRIDGDKCTDALVGWGVPMLLLIPIGIATQVALPGLKGFQEQVGNSIKNANTELQRQLGVFNPDMAKAAAELDATLRDAGGNLTQALIGLSLLAYGLAALVNVAVVCVPNGETLPVGDQSSVKNVSKHLKPVSSE